MCLIYLVLKMLSSEDYCSTIAFLNQADPEAAREMQLIQLRDTLVYEILPQWNATTECAMTLLTDLAIFQQTHDMFKNLRLLIEKFHTLYNIAQNKILFEFHMVLFNPISESTKKLIRYVIEKAFDRCFALNKLKNGIGNKCSFCPKNCDCLSVINIFTDLCYEIVPLGEEFVQRLYGDLPVELANKLTTKRVHAVFSADKEYHKISHRLKLEKWILSYVNVFIIKLYGTLSCVAESKLEQVRLHMYEEYGKSIIDAVLYISLLNPGSKSILGDLMECMKKVPLRPYALVTLSSKVEAEVLNPGVSSAHILTAYIHFVKCLRIVDPTGVFVDSVCHPIRQYLRQRSDTVRCIVSFLTDADFSRLNLKHELATAEESDEDDETEVRWNQWNPDPIDADPSRSRRSRRSADLLTMLVSVYGSKQSFVKEYAQLLAHRLLNNTQFDHRGTSRNSTVEMIKLERECLTLLKKRFGEADLLQCEVMLKDIDDSNRLHAHINRIHNYTGPISMSTRICSTHFWPKLKDGKLEIPPEIDEIMEERKKAFEKVKSKRTLEYFPMEGRVKLEIEIGGKTTCLTVTPLIASVLSCFAQKDEWSVDSLAAKLKVQPSVLKRKISAWGNRSGVLIETISTPLTWKVADRMPPNLAVQSNDKQKSGVSYISDNLSAEDSDESSAEESDAEGNDGGVIEEQLEMRWKYIQQLLRTCHTLAAERLLSLVRMMTSPGKQPTLDNVNRFLQKKCKDGLLVQHNNLYKLPPKPATTNN